MQRINVTHKSGTVSPTLHFEVAVVGGGIIGTTIAAALVETGIDTVLIDKGCCGAQGASRYSGGLVRLFDPDADIAALAAYSHKCLSNTGFGRAFAPTIDPGGLVYMCAEELIDLVRQFIDRHGSPQYPMRLLRGEDIRTVSGFVEAHSDRVVLYEQRGGASDVRGSTGAMANIVKKGGVVLENTPVEAIESDRGEARIHLRRAQIRAWVVVIAGGGWSAPWTAELGLYTRTIPFVRLFASQPLTIPIIDTLAETYAVPLKENLIQVGSQIRQQAANPESLGSYAGTEHTDALARLSQLSGREESGPVLDILPGFDAYTADRRPAIGFFSDDDPRYVATGMAGVGYKLAVGIAALARIHIAHRLGRRMVARQPQGDSGSETEALLLLQPFSPQRFKSRFEKKGG